MRIQSTILYVAERATDEVVQRFTNLSVPRHHEKLMFLDRTSEVSNQSAYNVPSRGFSLPKLTAKGYRPIANRLLPGSNHFPVIDYAALSGREFTWCIEWDVIFNGDWRRFFTAHRHSDADLLTAYVATRKDEPLWYWWESLSGPDGLTPRLSHDQFWKSFNPVYRISGRAARFLRSLYEMGWRGHHEVSMATLLMLGGYRVEDFGGAGSLVMPHNTGKWYSAETYRHTANGQMTAAYQVVDMLCHPVKQSLFNRAEPYRGSE